MTKRFTTGAFLIKTVLFCGRHNLPLRGDRDDGPLKVGSDGQFQTDFNESCTTCLSGRLRRQNTRGSLEVGFTYSDVHLKDHAKRADFLHWTAHGTVVSTTRKMCEVFLCTG